MQDIYSLAERLRQQHSTLSEYESLNLAIQYQRNELLKAGLVVSGNDSHPSALESIAMSMGEKPN